MAVAWCVGRARHDLDDRLVPMAGLVAAFIFAVQMLNFPVLPGVSGHLLGGALAAVLVGPWVGALCVTVVLVVQALVFADGGVTAIGLNVTNMAVVHTAVASLVVALEVRATGVDPWQRTFDAAHGAHVLANTPTESDARAIAARPEVARKLEMLGVMPADAQSRINALTDAEVSSLAARIDALPAGGLSNMEWLLVVIAVLVLIIAL